MKKYLAFLLVILFTSCSTTHKIKTESKKTVDSTVVAHVDTTGVSKAQTYTDNFTAKGVDITFDYGNDSDSVKTSDTTVWKPYYYSPTKDGTAVNNLIQQAAAVSGANGRIPTSVHIHIDSIGDSTKTVTSTDSSHVKSDTKAKVNTTTSLTTKDKTTTGMSSWVYIIGGILVLAGLVWLAAKFKLL